MKLGRPLKGKKKRIQITIYADMDVLNALDELVYQQQMAGDRSASRSEEYNKAMKKHLRDLGILK